MALGPNTKLAIQAKLRLGTPPKEVAELFDVKLPTVYAINNKLNKDIENDSIGAVNDLPIELISHIVEEAKKELLLLPPEQDSPMIEAFEAAVVGIEGLKKLDGAFQATMTNVLKRFDMLLLDQDTPLKDIIQITNTSASAYEKIFSSGTNIHIGDNNSQSNNQLTVFKNKQGV